MPTSTMRACLLLAPWMATLTYACPWAIVTASVAGARVARPMPKIRPATPPPAHVAVSVEPARPAKNLLVRKDDAWRSVQAPTDLDDEISDAKLSSTGTSGGREWEVESPITFSYKVREAPDVLNPESEALLFGHLSDPAVIQRAKSRPLKRVVVVDETVHALFGQRIEAYFAHHNVEMRLLVLPTTEENKNMDMVLKISEAIHDLGIDRRLDPVIAIGGGVCMDIVGFAASIYRRRTPYLRVPTTLMGYVDASIGAKTGVNFVGHKNKLGAYLPPVLTLLDRSFLATLDQRQLSNGAAEIAKMALVKDPELFDLLLNHGQALIECKFQDLPVGGDAVPKRVLDRAIETMLEELAPNLWEDSLDRLVDFGHVFSMELEMEVLYEDKLFHGEAVAIDMAFCSVLAHVRGQINEATLTAIIEMMRGLKLPVFHERFNSEMTREALYERFKFSQGQKIPLPTGAGVSRIFNDIKQDEVEMALVRWRERCA